MGLQVTLRWAGAITGLIAVLAAGIEGLVLADDWRVASQWQRVPASLQRAEAVLDPDHPGRAQWHVEVSYTYQVAGQTLTGRTLAPTVVWRRQDGAQSEAAELLAQPTHHAWADPQTPTRSVLTHQLQDGWLAYALVPGATLLAALGLVAASLVGRKRG